VISAFAPPPLQPSTSPPLPIPPPPLPLIFPSSPFTFQPMQAHTSKIAARSTFAAAFVGCQRLASMVVVCNAHHNHHHIARHTVAEQLSSSSCSSRQTHARQLQRPAIAGSGAATLSSAQEYVKITLCSYCVFTGVTWSRAFALVHLTYISPPPAGASSVHMGRLA